MPVVINGNGTVSGIQVGGFPDGIVDADMLAANAVTSTNISAGAVTSSSLASGAVTSSSLASGAGGKVLQVVQATETDVSSMTGAAFADLGLSVDITPSLSTSKVLVIVTAHISAATMYDAKLRLMRDSTAIHIGDAASNRPRTTVGFFATYASAGYGSVSAAISFLDSPATTSATTYKIQGMAYAAGTVIYMNRGPNDTDAASSEGRGASSIIAIEVAA
jgi:hypothetical protein